jgi:hypothetical protein
MGEGISWNYVNLSYGLRRKGLDDSWLGIAKSMLDPIEDNLEISSMLILKPSLIGG